MPFPYLDQLFEKKLLDKKQYTLLSAIYSKKIFSLYYELRTGLYLGVLSFTTGAGILIYENAGSLAHLLNNVVLSAIMLACFWYAGWHRAPFTTAEVESPTPYYDYVLLLGALLFLIIEGYLQNIYGVFGQQWGLAVAVPAALFFVVAYVFDHGGVLSLAIVTAAAAVGLQVSVVAWYKNNVFSEESLIYPAIIFSVCLTAIAFVLDNLKIKRHFTFSYLLWNSVILLTALLAALFQFQPKLLFFLILAATSAGAIYHARKTQTYVFFLIGVTSLYIAVTYMIARLGNIDPVIWYLYFLASCIGLVFFVIRSVRTLGNR
ncbi:MAG: hypothetical protein O7G31_13075 [Calditrichaeota bacterium]|nr:hypothetical protein [Calditrichota bacterium]